MNLLLRHFSRTIAILMSCIAVAGVHNRAPYCGAGENEVFKKGLDNEHIYMQDCRT